MVLSRGSFHDLELVDLNHDRVFWSLPVLRKANQNLLLNNSICEKQMLGLKPIVESFLCSPFQRVPERIKRTLICFGFRCWSLVNNKKPDTMQKTVSIYLNGVGCQLSHSIETCSAMQRLVNNNKVTMMPKTHHGDFTVIHTAQPAYPHTLLKRVR